MAWHEEEKNSSAIKPGNDWTGCCMQCTAVSGAACKALMLGAAGGCFRAKGGGIFAR